jgi:hypothetical protein
MHLDLTDNDLDYLHRVLLTRPMGEVEQLVLKIRAQVSQQQNIAPRAVSDDEPLEATQ